MRLSAAADPPGTAIGGAVNASFVYDAFGRRVARDVNNVTTEFLYDGLNPVQELDGNNPPNPTAELLTGLDIDEYFTRTDTSGAMAFLSDALGSTLALTDSSGAINTSYTYEPFGKTTAGGTNANPYQFTGRENDGTGLFFYRARYYSPTYQRFIGQDPLGFAGGDVNLYGYGKNSPTISPRPQVAIASRCSEGGKVSIRMACDHGTIASPAALWMKRNISISVSDCAMPHSAEAQTKTTTENRK